MTSTVMLSTGMMDLVDTYIGPLRTKNNPTVETPADHGSPTLGRKKKILAQ